MTTNIKQLTQNQLLKEVTINENFATTSIAAKFGWKNPSTTGLVFQIYGGTHISLSGTIININDGSLTMVASRTNYVEFNTTTNTFTVNQSAFTSGNIPLYIVTTDATKITNVNDERVNALQIFGVPTDFGYSNNSADNYFIEFGKLKVVSKINTGNTTKFIVEGGSMMFSRNDITSSQVFFPVNNLTYTTALTNNTTYYIFLRLSTSSGSTSIFCMKESELSSFVMNSDIYIMYRFTTNTTEINKIEDLRSLKLYYNNKKLIQAKALTASSLSSKFDFTFTQFNLGSLNPSQDVNPKLNYLDVNLTLICNTASDSYSIGEEVDFVTVDTTLNIASKPFALKVNYSNTVISVFLYDDIKIPNKTDGRFITPTNLAHWSLCCKLTNEYR